MNNILHTMKDKTDIFLKYFFYLSTLFLFVSIGLDRFTNIFFPCAALSSLWLLMKNVKFHSKNEIIIVLLPVFFIAYCFFSPGYPFKDMPVSERMIYSYLIGIAASLFFSKKISHFFMALAVCLCLSCAYCVFFQPGWMIQKNGQLLLFFHHPSVLGAVSAWCLLFFLTHYQNATNKYKMVSCFIIFFLFIILLLSVGRSAYLGFSLAFLFLLFFYLRKYIIKLIVFILIVSTVSFGFLPEQQQSRLLSIVENPFNDPTFKSRLPIWEVAVNGVRESPVLGNSIRGFHEYHKQYLDEHYASMCSRYPYVETTSTHTHNLFLGIMYSYGVIGTLLLLLGVIPAGVWAWKKKSFFFLSVLVFFIGYGVFEYSLHRKEGILMLFFPLGLIYGQHLLELQSAHKEKME